jgi:RimJ/RimL family protein N-acetyltransferase
VLGERVEIQGSRIVLRAYRPESDDEDFFRWHNLAEWQYYDEPDLRFEPLSRQAYGSRLAEQRRRAAQPDPTTQAWQIETVEGRHIGFVNYYGLDLDDGCAYVGIGLSEEETWGRGYGTEALHLLLGLLFGVILLQEVHTATWIGNVRMMRVARKCGFHEIGRSPYEPEVSVRGEPLERVEYAISRAEWLDRAGW